MCRNVNTRQNSDKNDHREPMRETDVGSDRPAKDLGYLRSTWAPFGSLFPATPSTVPAGLLSQALTLDLLGGPSPTHHMALSPVLDSGQGFPCGLVFFFFLTSTPILGSLRGLLFLMRILGGRSHNKVMA